MQVLITCDGDGVPVAYGQPGRAAPARTGQQQAVIATLFPPGTHDPGTITKVSDDLVRQLRDANFAPADGEQVVLVMVADGRTMLAAGPFDCASVDWIEDQRRRAADSGIAVIPVPLRSPPEPITP